MDRQKETISPAKVRTWIQAYDVMSYVDSNGINYNSNEVMAEIKGLFDANRGFSHTVQVLKDFVDKNV